MTRFYGPSAARAATPGTVVLRDSTGKIAAASLVLNAGGSGLDTAAAGALLIGPATATAIQLGGANNPAVQIGTGAGAQQVSIGVAGGLTASLLLSGNQGVVDTGNGVGLNIGTGNATFVTIGGGNAGAGLVNFGYASTALGGGAAPTLGTIGGTGPAVAAQNSWLKIQVAGANRFIALWA